MTVRTASLEGCPLQVFEEPWRTILNHHFFLRAQCFFDLKEIKLLLGRPLVLLFSYHGNPQPSFLGVITHILGVKTFIFHGFGVQG